MHLGLIIIFISLVVSLGVSLVIKILYKKTDYPYLSKPVVIIGLLLAALGFIFIPLFSNQLNSALSEKFQPTIDGIILSSKVIGDRAFRPDIEYQYIVSGDTLFGKSFLNQPGFGGRMNRLDAAEKTVQKYTTGSTVKVYYNPENPTLSTLSPGPTYSHFLRLSMIVCVLLCGSIIIMLRLLQPVHTKHIER